MVIDTQGDNSAVCTCTWHRVNINFDGIKEHRVF